MSNQPVGSPSCFGGSFSASDVECTGGPDPAYVHPQTQKRVRDKCGWYSACASTTAANKSKARQTQFIPVQQVTRNLQGPPRPATGHPMVGARPQVQHPQQFMPQQQYPQHQQYQQPMQQYPHMVAPYIAQQGPQIVPLMVQQPGAQMTHYLTVPEPINLNESPWKRLLREILRSMAKSAGHTGAAFFDHNPINPHKGPDDEVS